LLDRTGEREQPLLDENRHFADEVHRLAALLEDTRVPFDAIGQFVDCALVGITPILKLAQLENGGADLVGKIPFVCAQVARSPASRRCARIAPTMNRAVHPPTTASEIQLIWQ